MKKILVVGKDPELCEDLRKFFDPHEYTLFSSYDPENPIPSMINLKPDLIILDLSYGSKFGNLPQHWGVEIIKKLKEKNSNLPVIAVTDPMNPNSDSSCDQTMTRTIKEKAYGFVQKPIQPEKLSFMAKEALSSDINRTVHTSANTGRDQRELKGVAKVLNLSESPEKAKIDCEKTRKGYTAGKKDYGQMFDHLLTPIYDEILVNSKGNIYDHLISGLEKSLISLSLKYCRHNQVKASQILGISRNTLRERIKKYDLW